MTDGFDFGTADMTTGRPPGPAGCRDACIVVAITAVAMTLFVLGIWWGLKDVF